MSATFTYRIGLDVGATFELGNDPDDPDELVTFATDEDEKFMVMYLKAGDWVRMGRPYDVRVTIETQ